LTDTVPGIRGLKIPKRLGQKAIQITTALTLIEKSLKIRAVGDALIMPLVRAPSKDEEKTLREALDEYAVVTSSFPTKLRPVRSLDEALEHTLPPDLLPLLPRSMDIVGTVAILELSPHLNPWKRLVGQAVLRVNRNVTTVLAKAGVVEGEHRLRRLDVIAGTGETTVVHREYGCTYYVDPRVVYFSPRLSEERQRIARQVQAGEIVVDMFAGVGPFAIQIGTQHDDVTVYALDSNAKAYPFLMRNVKANGVEMVVQPLLGDVRALAERLDGVADRVIMDLPAKAVEFVDVACRVLKPGGGMLHYYCFEAEPAVHEKAVERLRQRVLESQRVLCEVVDTRRVRQIGPRRWHVVVDACIR
jgi:tRNA (guanine37-N1)-methyltransferase